MSTRLEAPYVGHHTAVVVLYGRRLAQRTYVATMLAGPGRLLPISEITWDSR
jgi:hypothetical protein